MQQVDISVFISTDDGVWETQERLSKQRLHKSGSNAEYRVCFKEVMTKPGPLRNRKNNLKLVPVVLEALWSRADLWKHCQSCVLIS